MLTDGVSPLPRRRAMRQPWQGLGRSLALALPRRIAAPQGRRSLPALAGPRWQVREARRGSSATLDTTVASTCPDANTPVALARHPGERLRQGSPDPSALGRFGIIMNALPLHVLRFALRPEQQRRSALSQAFVDDRPPDD